MVSNYYIYDISKAFSYLKIDKLYGKVSHIVIYIGLSVALYIMGELKMGCSIKIPFTLLIRKY